MAHWGHRGRGPRTLLAGALAFWVAFAVFVAVHTYLSMLSHGHSLARLVAYQLATCLFWALSTPAIAALSARFPLVPWRGRSVLVHGAAGAAFASAFAAWSILMNVSLRPYDVRSPTDLLSGFVATFSALFPFEVLVYAGIVGAMHALAFHERSRERALRAAELERALSEAKHEALAARLHPHFLFNTLHTVSSLIRAQQPAAAIRTLAGLSDLLRYALDARSPDAELGEELEVARRYLAIQSLRFGDRLEVRIDAEADALPARVPRLLLQPLVENAVRHGAAPDGEPAWLTIEARRGAPARSAGPASLRIGIANSARGVPPAEGEGHGIGLSATRARLEQLYGSAFHLDVRRLGDRFELALDLPFRTLADTPASHA
jgi:two-component system, LytTR family, sensor kinase